MVDLTVPEVDVQQQNNIEETDGERHKEKRQDLLHTHGKGATISKTSSKATQDPHYCQNHHGVEKTLFLNEETFFYLMNYMSCSEISFFLAVSRRTEAVMGIESLQQNNLSSKVKALAGTSEISPHLPAW